MTIRPSKLQRATMATQSYFDDLAFIFRFPNGTSQVFLANESLRAEDDRINVLEALAQKTAHLDLVYAYLTSPSVAQQEEVWKKIKKQSHLKVDNQNCQSSHKSMKTVTGAHLTGTQKTRHHQLCFIIFRMMKLCFIFWMMKMS